MHVATDHQQALRTEALSEPWAVRRTACARLFRGRMEPGVGVLPAMPLPEARRGITFGLAGTAIALRSPGGTFTVRPRTPWAVPSDGRWRVVTKEATDLRLVHFDGLTVHAPVLALRPIRFDGPERSVMRAAIKSATPVWLDEASRPIEDLAALGVGEVRTREAQPVTPIQDHDTTAAFVMMATWAIEQQQRDEDQRMARVLEHIEANLSDPAMTTASVAAHHRLSRRTLQAAFSAHGGAAAYIRRQRLAAVVRLLVADPRRVPDLDDVARATGLGSRRTLERAMQQVYGLTPLQARALVLGGGVLRERPASAESDRAAS